MPVVAIVAFNSNHLPLPLAQLVSFFASLVTRVAFTTNIASVNASDAWLIAMGMCRQVISYLDMESCCSNSYSHSHPIPHSSPVHQALYIAISA